MVGLIIRSSHPIIHPHPGLPTLTQLLIIPVGKPTRQGSIIIPGDKTSQTSQRLLSLLRFGFGILDGGKAVAIAASWKNVPPQKSCQVQGEKLVSLGESVRALGLDEGSVVAVSFEVPNHCQVAFVEHVEVVLSVEHPRRGEVEVVLISPSNTRTRLLGPRPRDTSDNGFSGWPLMSVETWGEKPHGSWRLYIADR